MASDITLASNVVEFSPLPMPRKRKPTPAERSESDEALLDRISDLWNNWAVRHGSPSVRFLTISRGAHCRRRIADLVQATGFQAEQAFLALLAKCDESFFVKGAPRKPLGFDQLLQESFMVRMMEGEFAWKNTR
jgi:hypothetical protein